MPRDIESYNYGYTAWLYQKTLEEGLELIYQPGQPFQQDNARIYTAYVTQRWFEDRGI